MYLRVRKTCRISKQLLHKSSKHSIDTRLPLVHHNCLFRYLGNPRRRRNEFTPRSWSPPRAPRRPSPPREPRRSRTRRGVRPRTKSRGSARAISARLNCAMGDITYQVVSEQLHDEGGVLVAFLAEGVELCITSLADHPPIVIQYRQHITYRQWHHRRLAWRGGRPGRERSRSRSRKRRS